METRIFLHAFLARGTNIHMSSLSPLHLQNHYDYMIIPMWLWTMSILST